MCYLTQPPVLFRLWDYCGGFATQTPKWSLGCRIACVGLSLGCIVVYVFDTSLRVFLLWRDLNWMCLSFLCWSIHLPMLVCLEGHDLLAIVKEHEDTRVSCGSLSLLFVMTGMVWHVLSNSHKVLTALIVILSVHNSCGNFCAIWYMCVCVFQWLWWVLWIQVVTSLVLKGYMFRVQEAPTTTIYVDLSMLLT